MRQWQPHGGLPMIPAVPLVNPKDDDQTYPIACPTCAALAGYPYQASTQIGRIDTIAVAMRCRACHYEWMTEVRQVSMRSGNDRTVNPTDNPNK